MNTTYHNKNTMFVSTIELLVANLKNSINFYENYLGLTVLEQSDEAATIRPPTQTTPPLR